MGKNKFNLWIKNDPTPSARFQVAWFLQATQQVPKEARGSMTLQFNVCVCVDQQMTTPPTNQRKNGKIQHLKMTWRCTSCSISWFSIAILVFRGSPTINFQGICMDMLVFRGG